MSETHPSEAPQCPGAQATGRPKNLRQDKLRGLAVLGGAESSALSDRVLQWPVPPQLETVPEGSRGHRSCWGRSAASEIQQAPG